MGEHNQERNKEIRRISINFQRQHNISYDKYWELRMQSMHFERNNICRNVLQIKDNKNQFLGEGRALQK